MLHTTYKAADIASEAHKDSYGLQHREATLEGVQLEVAFRPRWRQKAHKTSIKVVSWSSHSTALSFDTSDICDWAMTLSNLAADPRIVSPWTLNMCDNSTRDLVLGASLRSCSVCCRGRSGSGLVALSQGIVSKA